MNARRLSAARRKQMQAMLRKTDDARLCRRALAILEYDRGMSVNDVAELLGVSRQSVYNWIGRIQERGNADELRDAPRSGRPAKTGEVFDTLLKTLLILPPERFGYRATHWTVPLLRDQLEKNTGEQYSADTVRCGLHRLGYAWKRPRYVLMPDPEREKKTRNSPPPVWFARA
jgi:transposase